MNTIDTYLYDISIPAISSLQSQLKGQADFMQLMSTVFDPKYAFLIYSPIAYLCDQQVGKRLILTTVIAEWLNQILKWFFHGERPYWYVHSSGHFDPEQTPIKQYPITCELGPGHPSGHAMVTAAVWYIILNSLLQAYTNHTSNKEGPKGSSSTNTKANLSIWTIYFTLLATVSVSRVFLGCHFPHQCVAGAMLGLLVARWISSLETQAMHFIGASAFLFASAFGTFGLLQTLGFDPSWTIRLATTHCEKREYIHLDTAPFFSIMRYCGFALGCGLGLLFPLKSVTQQLLLPDSQLGALVAVADEAEVKEKLKGDYEEAKVSRNITWFSFKLLMALLMARLVDNLGLFVSHSNLGLFYSCAFVAYTIFSFAFINL